LESSPQGRLSTKGIEQKKLAEEKPRSPPKVDRSPPKVEWSSPGEKFSQSPDTSSIEAKVMNLKNTLALDVTQLQKEDNSRVDKVEAYSSWFIEIIES